MNPTFFRLQYSSAMPHCSLKTNLNNLHPITYNINPKIFRSKIIMPYTQFLADETATIQFGRQCAALFRAPAIVYLNGDLGAGKTTFTRGLLRGMGHTGTVKSPTYAIVESYTLPEITINHFDLYRFSTAEEWEDAGLDDLTPNSLCLIEWAQQGSDYVPAPDYIIEFTHQDNGRQCIIHAQTPNAQKELAQWQTTYSTAAN